MVIDGLAIDYFRVVVSSHGMTIETCCNGDWASLGDYSVAVQDELTNAGVIQLPTRYQ